MKKFLKAILFLCAISSLAYAEEATAVAIWIKTFIKSIRSKYDF